MKDYKELRKELLADGNLTDNEVEKLRNYLVNDDETDGRQKAEFLFELKDSISAKKMPKSFERLFIEFISAYVLEDEDSPGEIDETEAKWLRAKIQLKGHMDKVDERLLADIKQKSINYPKLLNYKGKMSKFFENILYSSRYLTLLAVIGSLLSAVILFVRSSMFVVYGLIDFYKTTDSSDVMTLEHLMATFVTSVDTYLFAMVLIIFGMGIYELFINKMDPVEQQTDDRPTWLQIRSIDDLKSSLGKVILMVLIVSLFEHSLKISYESAIDLLYLAVGVVLVAGALFLAHAGSKHEAHEEKKKE